MKQTTGFTLLEILIALAIFAVVAVAAAIGLRSVLKTHEHLTVIDERLREMITAETLMRRDITQMIARPIKDTSGETLTPLSIPNKTQFEFTRTGYSNPMQMYQRSELQRVAYRFSKNEIYRITWPVLDRAQHTLPTRSVILTGVSHIKLTYVNQKGELVEVWSTTASQGFELPQAIIVTLTLSDMGHIKWIFPIRGHSYE